MDGESESHDTTAIEPRSGLAVAAIREQLGHILASPDFHATDKVRDFLRYIVEEKLAGRGNRLKGYTIAVSVFGRGEDFDAANDPIVRIQAGRLRRALERYYLTAGNSDPILIDIPKGRYVPRFASLSDHEGDDIAAVEPVRKIFPERRAHPTIAVLPITNLTLDADQLPLTVGLTDELVTELTHFQDIVVIACHAAQQPDDFPADPVAIGRKVGARFVLEATVRHDDESIKVSAHLIDTTAGERIWAESYVQPLEASRLIGAQEELARNVVAAIASEYGIMARRLSSESRKKPPLELRTYEAVLRYYSHQISPSPESGAACFAVLRAAADREPDYAPLWSALATLYCQMYTFGVNDVERPLETALDCAQKAVILEPGLQLGRLILAYVNFIADDMEVFDEESAIALSLNPNSLYATGVIAYLNAMRGDLDFGLPALEQTISRCPCHPAWFHAGFVIDHLLHDDFERALAKTRHHRPFISYWDEVMIAALLGRLGRSDEARPHVDAVRAQMPDFAGRARNLIERGLKIPRVVDGLIEGLRRVGLAE
jgi:adenylate cyclase